MAEKKPLRDMKKATYSFTYRRYALEGDFPKEYSELVEAARRARAEAHAPYSDFHVGAAALLQSGRIITAANQESSSFPASICAEHNLLSYHNALMPEDKIVALAIVSQPDNEECSPCGVCRQVLCDTETRQQSKIKIIMCSATTATIVESASCLMPFAFNFNHNE